jgi:MmyB-like transcription regulator ligand binding domain
MFLCDPAWNVVAVNGAWTALQAGAQTGHPRDWNVAWRTFCNALGGISRTDDHAAGFQAMLAGRLGEIVRSAGRQAVVKVGQVDPG